MQQEQSPDKPKKKRGPRKLERPVTNKMSHYDVRLATLEGWIAQGFSWETCKKMAKSVWGISDVTLHKYMQEATQRYAFHKSQEAKHCINTVRTDTIIERAMAVDDFKSALSAIEMQSRLLCHEAFMPKGVNTNINTSTNSGTIEIVLE